MTAQQRQAGGTHCREGWGDHVCTMDINAGGDWVDDFERVHLVWSGVNLEPESAVTSLLLE